MRRKWVKIWVDESLTGTVRFDLTPAERSIWYDLIILAGACRVPGQISSNETTPFPHDYIANLLQVPLDLLQTTLKKLADTGRVSENENGIHITNWLKYQSEYDRQKKYRGRKETQDKDKYIKGKYQDHVKR